MLCFFSLKLSRVIKPTPLIDLAIATQFWCCFAGWSWFIVNCLASGISSSQQKALKLSSYRANCWVATFKRHFPVICSHCDRCCFSEFRIELTDRLLLTNWLFSQNYNMNYYGPCQTIKKLVKMEKVTFIKKASYLYFTSFFSVGGS